MTGLAFECLECGKCCSGPEEGFVWVTEEEIATLAEAKEISIAAFRKQYCRKAGRRISLIEKANKDCVLLEDGKCTVYHARPTQCRTWPFWSRNLETPDDWSWAASRCPGINRGKLYTPEEIQQRVRITDD